MLHHYTQGCTNLHSLNSLELSDAINRIAYALDTLPYLRRRLRFIGRFPDGSTVPSHVAASRLINGYIAGQLDSAQLRMLDELLLLTIS
jgi:hypothetical protein